MCFHFGNHWLSMYIETAQSLHRRQIVFFVMFAHFNAERLVNKTTAPESGHSGQTGQKRGRDDSKRVVLRLSRLNMQAFLGSRASTMSARFAPRGSLDPDYDQDNAGKGPKENVNKDDPFNPNSASDAKQAPEKKTSMANETFVKGCKWCSCATPTTTVHSCSTASPAMQ